MQSLGDYIKARRLELGYSMADVAKLSGVSKATVAILENGTTKSPSVETLGMVAKAIRVSPETLLAIALHRQLSRPSMEGQVAALIEALPLADQEEILAMLEAMAAARMKRLGRQA